VDNIVSLGVSRYKFAISHLAILGDRATSKFFCFLSLFFVFFFKHFTLRVIFATHITLGLKIYRTNLALASHSELQSFFLFFYFMNKSFH
jgi:hypothetical protein